MVALSSDLPRLTDEARAVFAAGTHETAAFCGKTIRAQG
jgi:hypothetical protein